MRQSPGSCGGRWRNTLRRDGISIPLRMHRWKWYRRHYQLVNRLSLRVTIQRMTIGKHARAVSCTDLPCLFALQGRLLPSRSFVIREVSLVQVPRFPRFFIFAVLHRVVDVTQNCPDGIRLCEVQRQERYERMIFNLRSSRFAQLVSGQVPAPARQLTHQLHDSLIERMESWVMNLFLRSLAPSVRCGE